MAESRDDELVACLTRAGAEITQGEMAWLKGCLLDEERAVEAWWRFESREKHKYLLVATQVRLLNLHFGKDGRYMFCDSVFLGDIVRVVVRWIHIHGWELFFLTAGQSTEQIVSFYSDDTKVIMSAWRIVQRLVLAAKGNIT